MKAVWGRRTPYAISSRIHASVRAFDQAKPAYRRSPVQSAKDKVYGFCNIGARTLLPEHLALAILGNFLGQAAPCQGFGNKIMMTSNDKVSVSVVVQVGAIGIHLPGKPIRLAEIDQPDAVSRQLEKAGQEITYSTGGSSTDLAVSAARETLEKSGIGAADIGMVISAPTLLTEYGLEIPAVAIRAELGLANADCLNIAQGCVGVLAAIRFGAQFLRCEPDRGAVLIVTACKASSLVKNFTHGAFSWGDAAAGILITGAPGEGPTVEFYAEKSAAADWGAMRIPLGDSYTTEVTLEKSLQIKVDFPSHEAQIDYIVGEKERCCALIDSLTGAAGIEPTDIGAVFLPSFGRKRVLFRATPTDRPGCIDFQCAHLGDVDVLYFLDSYLRICRHAVDGRCALPRRSCVGGVLIVTKLGNGPIPFAREPNLPQNCVSVDARALRN